MKKGLFIIFIICLYASTIQAQEKNPIVIFKTTLGDITFELYPQSAPETVKNFIGYVNDGFYNDTIFHRVIPNFMIQAGGFTTGMKKKSTKPSIINEANNGLKNKRGMIAMARTNNPHSATSQFFINTKDNPYLDHRDKTKKGWGYCVFGKVIKGIEVINKIESTPTHSVSVYYNDVPKTDIVIKKAEIVKNHTKVVDKKQ